MASDPIPENVRKIWDSWSIRALVVVSLSLQILLVLFSSFRKKTGNMMVYSLLWAAYLLADWVPAFTAGLIVNSLSTRTGYSSASAADRYGWDDDLLALWAATLLRHLGGTCAITAFSLEDNELWLRHFVGLIVQFTTAFYVFLCTLPNNKLLLPTIFALLGGVFNYAQRVGSMYLATLDKFREQIVTHPYKLEKMYTELGLDKLFGEDRSERLRTSDVALVAYHYFQIFKGLIVDVQFKPLDKEQSIKIFRDKIISSDDAFEVIICELNYMYEVLYTNQDFIYKLMGVLSWEISLISAAVVLGKFARVGKQDFHHVDVTISYALFIVSVVLDVAVFYGQALRPKSPYPLMPTSGRFVFFSAVMISGQLIAELNLGREPTEKEGTHMGYHINSKIKHGVYDTPIMFRQWSESICSHNLISYCLKECPQTISRPYEPCRDWIGKILHLPLVAVTKIFILCRGVIEMMGLKDILDRATYVSRGPMPEKLWDFIFNDLLDMSSEMRNGAAKLTSEARGEWHFQNREPSCDHRELLAYIGGVEYDEILLQWHIATELCYNAEVDSISEMKGTDHREFSKILSDYMLYLMVFQPGMMSTISGVFLRNYKEICNRTSDFLAGIHLVGGDGKLKEACRRILESKEKFKERNGSKSLLYGACTLANDLKRVPKEQRWKIIFRVWLEMLMYAAGHCRGDIHARSLSRGGELLSIIWLLMAHFEIIGNDQEDEAITNQQEHCA